MSETLHDRHTRRDDIEDDEKAAKRLRRAERALENRQLEPWERYRALTDVLDSYIDLVEIADRKARFALLILGALNAVNLALVTRPQLAEPLDNAQLIGSYSALYIIVSLFLLMRTVNALQPRVTELMRRAEPGEAGTPAGVRFIGQVMRQSPEQYYERWRTVEVGEVNRELARQVHTFAGINLEKYRALGHVYVGLIALALLTAAFVIAVIVARARL